MHLAALCYACVECVNSGGNYHEVDVISSAFGEVVVHHDAAVLTCILGLYRM